MGTDQIEQAKHIKDQKDIINAIYKMVNLQFQMSQPTRQGMIDALNGAQSVAQEEIIKIEHQQGDTIPTPWGCFQDPDLYRKLFQYHEALRRYCIDKIGKHAFEGLMKEVQKN